MPEGVKWHEGFGWFQNKYFERIMIEYLSGVSKTIKKEIEVDANVYK